MTRARTILMVLFLVATLVGPQSAETAYAAGPIVGGYSRVYNGSYLRMRTGPGYGYAVKMNMPKGAVVRIVSGPHNSQWYKVTYRGNTGYSVRSYLTHVGLAGTSIARNYYRVIVVSLARQQLEAYLNGRLQFVSAATTGRPELKTPTGTFKVIAKLSPYKFVSPWPPGSPYYYEPEWTKYAMRYRWDGYYIHDAPWRPYYGYGTNVWHTDPDGVRRTGSHGCVNLPLWSMQKVWAFAPNGTIIRVVSS